MNKAKVVGICSLCLGGFANVLASEILFVGNSHTSIHNIPAMVTEMLGQTGKYSYNAVFCAHLEDGEANPDFARGLARKPAMVVFQAQMISQSHKYNYSIDPAFRMVNLAKQAGAVPLLYSEFPRQDIDESSYIFGIYSKIAKKTGARVIPVGHTWDVAFGMGLGRGLWQPDGNHQNERGAMLTAMTIYFWIAGDKAPDPIVPRGFSLDAASYGIMKSAARHTVREFRAKKPEFTN